MNINKTDMINCDHKNNETVIIDGKEFLKCLDCGTQIPTEPISSDQLHNAIDICREVLNQLKKMKMELEMIYEEPEQVDHSIDELGQIAYELDMLGFDSYGPIRKKLKENKTT